jgi:hypothetical protein
VDQRVAFALAACVSLIVAAPAWSQVTYTPDITVDLSGTTVSDEDVAEDDLVGTVGLANLGSLPDSVEVDAYTRDENDEHLFSIDIAAVLPGGVFALPGDIIRYDGSTYSIEFDSIAGGIPDGANVDALMLSNGFNVVSFDTTLDLGGGLVAADEDLVQLGGGPGFVMFFDASAAGIDPALDLDAADWRAASGLLVSFDRDGSVGGVDFDDDTVLAYTGIGAWSVAFDASDEHAGFGGGDLIAVPEPGSLPGLAAGATLLVGLARRRRRKPRTIGNPAMWSPDRMREFSSSLSVPFPSRCLLVSLALGVASFSAMPAESQTVVAPLTLEVWANVSDPVDLSASPDGSLFVGRDLAGSGGAPDAAIPIHRIAPDGSVTQYGPSISDPDTVLVDAVGAFGSVGAVLVGGSETTGGVPVRALVTEVDTLQNATVLFGPTTTLLNPSGLAIDAAGDLLLTDFNLRQIKKISGATLSTIATHSVGFFDIVIHPTSGDLYASTVGGPVRRYTAGGALLDANFASGRPLAFDLGASPPDLYTINPAGELHKIAPDKTVTVLGSGFTSVYGLDFGPDGSLFLTEFNNDRVLRVGFPPPPVPALGPGAIVALFAQFVAAGALATRRSGKRSG